jgi:hypothetical protein
VSFPGTLPFPPIGGVDLGSEAPSCCGGFSFLSFLFIYLFIFFFWFFETGFLCVVLAVLELAL